MGTSIYSTRISKFRLNDDFLPFLPVLTKNPAPPPFKALVTSIAHSLAVTIVTVTTFKQRPAHEKQLKNKNFVSIFRRRYYYPPRINWASRTRVKMNTKKIPNRMMSKSVQQLREQACISVMDLQWVTGSMARKWKVDDNIEISDPSFSSLIRYLIKYPEEIPLPQIPTFNDIEFLIEKSWNSKINKKFNTKRIGPLLGCAPLAGYKWKKETIPSQLISHLMLILSNALKKEGERGLMKFIGIVDDEARARGTTLNEVWDKGWMPYLRRKESEIANAADPVGDARNTNKMMSLHVQQLRERMRLSVIDMQWLTGSMIRKWKVDEKIEISDPSFSILIRYLTKYPEECPLPAIPDVNDIETLLSMYWDSDVNQKSCSKRVGVLFGCTPLAGYKWSKDVIPSQIIRHMMLIVSNAIKKDGKNGLTRFIDVVKEEARSRGISSKDLWIKGWAIADK